MTIPEGANVLKPRPITNLATDLIAAATDGGHLLLFPVSDLPLLSKGKGNKIIQIPSAKAGKTKETVVAITT
ncbi:hypothetical protein ABTE87_22125, partial [Acinetobacter baumannii]